MEDDRDQLETGAPPIPGHVRAEYANVIAITCTPLDFRLVFGLGKTPMSGPEYEAAVEDGVVHPEAVAEIILSATASCGVPRMNPEGPGKGDEEPR